MSCRLCTRPALSPPPGAPGFEIRILPAKAAFRQENGRFCRQRSRARGSSGQQHMGKPGRQRQARKRTAMGSRPPITIERAKRGEPRPRLCQSSGRRRIKPGQLHRVCHAPKGTIKQQGRQICL